MLMDMRDFYDEVMQPIAESTAMLRAEIDAIVKASGSARRSAALLMEAGIEAAQRQDLLNDDGHFFRRTKFEMLRDGVTVKIVTPWDPGLARAAREMIKLAAEIENTEETSISP
jgi:hypothetical protein